MVAAGVGGVGHWVGSSGAATNRVSRGDGVSLGTRRGCNSGTDGLYGERLHGVPKSY